MSSNANNMTSSITEESSIKRWEDFLKNQFVTFTCTHSIVSSEHNDTLQSAEKQDVHSS
jgi:hypothetical protein